jgi:hypothetical protein
LRRPGAKRINVTVDRRLQAHAILEQKWNILCDDLLDESRKRVRLYSAWTFRAAAA